VEYRTKTPTIRSHYHSEYELILGEESNKLIYTYDTGGDGTGITKLLQTIQDSGLQLKDMQTTQSSLEDIFVTLVHQKSDEGQAA